MRSIISLIGALALSACSHSQAGPTPLPDGGVCVPQGGSATLGGCAVFPADSEWNRDVSCDEVDPASSDYLGSMGAGSKLLHPDFGSDPTYGFPYAFVDGGQPRVPMEFDYASQSDPGPYPFPSNAKVEGGTDGHVLIVDTSACVLYEAFDAHLLNPGPGWHCGSGARFDLRSSALRPDGWTSADAAGLPILPGLVRYDEAMAGTINHALRFTARSTQKAFVHPATHFASSITDQSAPPMGLRVRLKNSFDLKPFHGASLAVLRALQRYGMLVADNGSDWYISGANDTRWNDADLDQIKHVPAAAFEVVKLGTIHR